jgi:hypothetical protein
MGWHDANRAVREIVAEAFDKAGAKRPSWRESQAEWTDGGVIRDTRVTCANCRKGLDLGQRIYCCKNCADAHRARLHRADNLNRFRAIERLRNVKRRLSGEREGTYARSERWKDARDKARANRDRT